MEKTGTKYVFAWVYFYIRRCMYGKRAINPHFLLSNSYQNKNPRKRLPSPMASLTLFYRCWLLFFSLHIHIAISSWFLFLHTIKNPTPTSYLFVSFVFRHFCILFSIVSKWNVIVVVVFHFRYFRSSSSFLRVVFGHVSSAKSFGAVVIPTE